MNRQGQGNRPGSQGQQTQNPMQPKDPSVSDSEREEEEEEETGGGTRQQDEEEATSIDRPGNQQSNNQGGQTDRGSQGNQGR